MDNSFQLLDAHKGLGTAFWIELFLTPKEKETLPLSILQKHIIKTIEQFENTYSRFKADSLLSTLNACKAVPYDEDLAFMLKQGEEASLLSKGVFSLFIKEKLEEKGYLGAKLETITTTDEQKSSVTITQDTITLTGNKGIDLGGIGKGYLIDKLAKIIKDDYSIPYFLINGGGDMYLTSNKDTPITLYLEHPINEGEYLTKIELKDRAFCCSSSFKRRWAKDGKQVNHFIADKEVWAASYVVGEKATQADIYATVLCIIANNNDEIVRISRETHIDYVVISDDEKPIVSSGFPEFLE